VGPVRFATKATVRPSGLTAGAYSSIGSQVRRTGLPPAAGTTAVYGEVLA